MADEDIDEKRRDFLKATTAVGAVGVMAAAVPFVASMLPSEDVEQAGAPIKIDIRNLKPGEQLTVLWRGKPIWVIHRTQEALESLDKDEYLLRDPNSSVDQQPPYAANRYKRSIRPEILSWWGYVLIWGVYRPIVLIQEVFKRNGREVFTVVVMALNLI